jgi:glycosyltransferase involved in cell wall biosynthesis
VKALKREGLPILIDVLNLEEDGSATLFKRLCFWNRYHDMSKGIRRSKTLSVGAYDMIIVPSSLQGVSRILVHAMGNGVPAMIQNRPELKEIVDENTGWILDKDTESEDINRILRELVRNSDIIHQKGLAAKQFVEKNHSWEGFKQEVTRFYNNSLTGK